LLLIAGICGDITTSRAADGPAPLACADDARVRHFDLLADGRDLRFRAESDAWIEIRESRQTVTVGGTALEKVIDIPLPLRFGDHWLKAPRGAELWVRRFSPGNADGGIDVVVHCTYSAELQQRIAWLEQAGRVNEKIAAESDPEFVAEMLAKAHALAESAASAADAALAQHLIAQTLMINGRNVDASDAFAAAEAAWNKAGNANGALAAHLGRVGSLTRTGSSQAVMESTRPPPSVRERQTYLLLRVEFERCIALQNLARLDEAEQCYEWTLAGYRQLREDVEYMTVLQAYASSKRDRGDFDAAQRLAEQSLQGAKGPYGHMIRGRCLLTLADLALRRGDVAQSLQQLNEALQEFTVYRDRRWQGNTYMKLADLYDELGSYDEAYAALMQAVQRFTSRDDAPRLATAILSFAELERRNDRLLSALWWSAAAETMFRALKMPARTETVQLFAATVRVDGADATKLQAPPIESVPAEDAGKWRLVRAKLALAQNHGDDARAELNELQRMPLALSDRVQATMFLAELQAAGGDAAAAQTTLAEAAARVQTLAQRAHSDVLRYVIARQDQELRRAGLRLILEQQPMRPEAADGVWRWLAMQADAAAPAGSRDHTATHDEAFDRAVASELLAGAHDATGTTKSNAVSQRELLSRLAGPSDGESSTQAAATQLQSLSEFQAALPADSAFVAYVDGGTRGALLWLTHDDARLLPAAAPDRMRGDVVAMQVAAKDPRVPLTERHAAALQLSSALFAATPVTVAPRRLYVLADAVLRGVPWGAVAWPGASGPLVETTATATVRFSREAGNAQALAVPREIRVVVSAQRGAPSSSLPVLAGAEVEAAQIRGAMSGDDLRVVEDAQATRDTIDRAFAQPGAWVHVAAHGSAQPQRIGYAGLWLEPKPPETEPAFLSWIDVLDRGVRSDLVVLDACQTGDSGTAVNGNLSFADAVSRAGSRHVLAVMWPASDAASAVWVPAFYAALAADANHDAAEALQVAQQRLRASRAFSHPFYWAGMQTIERWPIGSIRMH